MQKKISSKIAGKFIQKKFEKPFKIFWFIKTSLSIKTEYFPFNELIFRLNDNIPDKIKNKILPTEEIANKIDKNFGSEWSWRPINDRWRITSLNDYFLITDRLDLIQNLYYIILNIMYYTI